jgi:hypothetical protein
MQRFIVLLNAGNVVGIKQLFNYKRRKFFYSVIVATCLQCVVAAATTFIVALLPQLVSIKKALAWFF